MQLLCVPFLEICLSYRWVEKKQFADRLLPIWPNIKKIVKFWERLPKSKKPASKSCLNVVDAVNDHFITVKHALFCYLSSLVEPFLEKYQNDTPMLPFMYENLKMLLKSLLKLVVKQDKLEACKIGYQLKDLNLNDEHILLPLKDMEMNFEDIY